MSGTLYWGPMSRGRSVGGDILRDIIINRDIPYLEGLSDAGVDGAKELIDRIMKIGAIQVDVEY